MSIAAASFFLALVTGIWEKRANRAGALAGMWVGFGTCLNHIIGSRFCSVGWWGIETISSGLFRIALGFIAIFLVSRMTAPPSRELQVFVENVRIPKGTAQPHGGWRLHALPAAAPSGMGYGISFASPRRGARIPAWASSPSSWPTTRSRS